MKDFPVIKFALAFITGILLQPIIRVNFYIAIILIVVLLTLFVISKRKKIFQNINLLLTFLSLLLITSLGNITAQFNQNKFNPIVASLYREKNIIAGGEIEKIELKRDNEILFLLNANQFVAGDLNITDRITFLCKLRGGKKGREEFYEKMKPGYIIEVTGIYSKGKERRNPGEFDYNSFLRSEGITGIIIINKYDEIKIVESTPRFFDNVLFQLRKNINEQITLMHNKETAALLRGLLLADRKEIDQETKTLFINSGVVHVLAVSGLHVGFIALIFIILFGRFNIYFRSVLTIIGLLGFMFITGIPPSVFRATVMALVIILAFLTNRSTNIFNSLAIAALIILILNPNEIYSPGFQLSFSAVLAIGIIYPFTSGFINKLKLKSKILKYLLLFIGVSLAAQIGTLPLTLIYFGKLSVVALLANLIVIPAIGLIIALSVVTLVIGAILPTLASYYAITNNLVTELLFNLINFAGSLSFSHIKIRDYTVYDAIIFYFFIAFFLLFIKKMKVKPAIILFVTLTTLNIFLFSSLDDESLLPDNKLSILMIDVGQGDAILIKFPNNQTALIDAGQATFYFDYGERVILPLLDYLGIDKIDYGFVSHLDLDHYGGFVSLIQNDRVKEIYKPEIDSSLQKDIKFEKFLIGQNIPFKYYNEQSLLPGNCKVYILNDMDKMNFYALSSNNKSSVIKLVYGNSSFLFTGDAEKRVEEIFIDDYKYFLDVDVLKVGHHGSKTSTSDEFIKYTSPHFALISAGVQNKFGHPDNEILLKLKEAGTDILRTDVSGAIILNCDGENIIKQSW